jgi:hypothetical protein
VDIKLNRKVILIAAGTAAAVLLVLACLLLFGGIAKLKQERANLKGAVTELEGFFRRKPFPSDENVGIERANIKALGTWYETLVEACADGQVESGLRRPSVFQRRLTERIDELRKMAKKTGTRLSERPAFGFHRYAIQGRQAAPEHVPRLTQQMIIIDHLCKIMMEADVHSIGAVLREEFEDARPASPGGRVRPGAGGSVINRTGGMVRTGGRSIKKSKLPATADAGQIDKDKLFAYFRFRLEVSASEAALWRVMNRFAADDMFIVLKGVTLKKRVPDVQMPKAAAPVRRSSAVSGAGGVRPVIAAAPAGTNVVAVAAGPKRPLDRNLRQVSGSRLSKPMAVTLDVAVYRFRKE